VARPPPLLKHRNTMDDIEAELLTSSAFGGGDGKIDCLEYYHYM
jgi:hypothetical protein